VAETVIALSETAYPNVREREAAIKLNCNVKNPFPQTLERGETTGRNFERAARNGANRRSHRLMLYDTYGFL